MIDTSDEIRTVRAELATLFEPDHPSLREYVDHFGPLDAYRKITTGQTGVASLRAEPAHHDVLTAARRAGTRILIPEDADWPTRLTGPDRPLCLWVRGDLPDLEHSVTITGSRAATEYGTHIAAVLGYGLATCGWTVLNAAGFGIDAAALAAAMRADQTRAAVAYACGLDRPHPPALDTAVAGIAGRGAVSMWPPATPPTRRRIDVNGQLLAALSTGTVIVEAHSRSRAFGILRHALHLGRAAMVVPGPVTSAMSAGTNNAARDLPGVRIVTTAHQIHRELAPDGSR